MTFRERIEWLLRMCLLVFVLAAAAFLSGVMAMRFAIQGREVDMPNLVGKNSAEVQALLSARGLQLKVADRIYSELPANTVVRQSPPAGEHMKISQDAHVVLSLGRQNVKIPGLEGETLRVARIQLLQAGLQLGEVTSLSVPNLPADSVVQQNPLVGDARRESAREFAGGAGQYTSRLYHALAGGHATAGRGSVDFKRWIKDCEEYVCGFAGMAKRDRRRANPRPRCQGDERHSHRTCDRAVAGAVQGPGLRWWVTFLVGQALFIPSPCEGLPVQRESATSHAHRQECLSCTTRDSGKIRAEKPCPIWSKLPPRFLPRTSHPWEKEFAPWNEAAPHCCMWM